MNKRFKFIFMLATVVAALSFTACNLDREDEPVVAPTASNASEPKHARLYAIKEVGNASRSAVAVKDKVWEPGSTIKIKFLNGDTDIQNKVKQYAAEWLQYANLKFEYVSAAANADVKIGFEWGDDMPFITWSTIGTDCQAVPQDEASLNFVALSDESDEFIKAEVLRGFGHVLGLGFEHRSPGSDIEFKCTTSTDKKRLEGFFNMSIEDIMTQIVPRYMQDQTNYTEYDELSIMRLGLPPTILKYPPKGVLGNIELSETDKTFMAELYPKMYFKRVIHQAGLLGELREGLCNVMYSFNPCGVTKIDLSSGIGNLIYTGACYLTIPVKVDNLIYFENDFKLCYIDITTDVVTETNMEVGLRDAVKSGSGTTYINTSQGLFYLDKNDGLLKPKQLSSPEVPATCVVKALARKSDGTVYAMLCEGQHIYMFHIDSNETATFLYKIAWGQPLSELITSNNDGKVYLKTYSIEKGAVVFGTIDNDNVFNYISTVDGIDSPIVGRNNKVYFCSAYLLKLLNGTHLAPITHEFSHSDMYFLHTTKIATSIGIFVFARYIENQSNPDESTWIWNFSLYFVDYKNDTHSKLVKKSNLMVSYPVETTNGDIYFSSTDGLWKLVK